MEEQRSPKPQVGGSSPPTPAIQRGCVEGDIIVIGFGSKLKGRVGEDIMLAEVVESVDTLS